MQRVYGLKFPRIGYVHCKVKAQLVERQEDASLLLIPFCPNQNKSAKLRFSKGEAF